MRDWGAAQMATLVASVLSSSHSSTQVTYSNAGEVLQFRGSLGGYNQYGDPTTGSVTSFTYTTPQFGASTMSVVASNFVVSVQTLYTWIFTSNTSPFHHFLFDGGDTMTGSIGP